MPAYTREEIEAFVRGNLHIVGEQSRTEEAVIRASFVDSIEQLLPHQQVLLIETHRANIIGDAEEIQRLYGGEHAVLGFFQPGRLSSEFNNSADRDQP